MLCRLGAGGAVVAERAAAMALRSLLHEAACAPFPLLLPLSFCVWPTQQRTEETGGRCDSILDGTVALLAFAGGELCLSQAVEKRPALVAPRRIEPSSSKSSSKALT